MHRFECGQVERRAANRTGGGEGQTWRSEALPAVDQVHCGACKLRWLRSPIFVRVAQTVAVDVPSNVWRGVMADGEVVHE